MEPFILKARPGTAISTLTQALALLPEDASVPARIELSPGVYREKAVVARANTEIVGAGTEKTRIVWGDGAKELLPDGMKRGTFRTATLRIDASNVKLCHLCVENDAAPREAAGQAIALYADGDLFVAEDCKLLGAQDTLFTAPLPPREIEKNGFIGPKQHAPRVPQRQVYLRCSIVGDVDFIFGGAAAWFERCDIITRDGRSDRSAPFAAFCTAASTPEGQAFGYVFDHCRFIGEGCPDGSVYLGRPWREWAKTVLLNCELGPHIRREGFDDWNKPLAHETAFFAEYDSFGPGAQGPRAPFVHALTPKDADAITFERFLGSLGSC